MVTGEPLFRGRTSEIHRWHNDRTVVKLYPAGEPIKRAEQELHNTRTAADQGVRVPAVGNVVTVDGRHGFTMALVASDSLMDRIENGSTGVEDTAVQLAELQAEVTGRSAPGMDPQRQIVGHRVANCSRLTAAERAALLARDEHRFRVAAEFVIRLFDGSLAVGDGCPDIPPPADRIAAVLCVDKGHADPDNPSSPRDPVSEGCCPQRFRDSSSIYCPRTRR